MSYRRLNLTNFRSFKLDLAFTAFSHDDSSSNSGLDGCVDSWPHILKDRSFAQTQLGTDGAEICLLTRLFRCDNCITPINISPEDVTYKYKLHIPALPPLTRSCGFSGTPFWQFIWTISAEKVWAKLRKRPPWCFVMLQKPLCTATVSGEFVSGKHVSYHDFQIYSSVYAHHSLLYCQVM